MKSDDVDRIIEEMITDKNSLRKAAEMALETLCVGANDAVPNDIDERFEQAIQALRQALAHEALDRMVAENQRLGLYDDAVNMSQERVDETAKGEHEPVACEAKLKEKNGG